MGNNKERSSVFVSSVADLLAEEFKAEIERKEACCCVQKFNEKIKKRIPGEWLLDIVIAKQTELRDEKKKRSKAKMISEILWAVESESDTGLDQFAKDFGKLLCVNSKNYLYLNGMNQSSAGMKDYKERRLETIKNTDFISERLKEINGRFFIGFWPVPELWRKKDENYLLENLYVTTLK